MVVERLIFRGSTKRNPRGRRPRVQPDATADEAVSPPGARIPGDGAQQMNQLRGRPRGADNRTQLDLINAGATWSSEPVAGDPSLGHLAQIGRPSAVQRSRDRDVCGAKQVAPSVSPMGSDPGDTFALGRRAASCRPCRAKIDARSHSCCGATVTLAKMGDRLVPRPPGIQFKPATQPRRNNISRASDDRDLEI